MEVLLGSGIRCEVFGGIAIPPRLIVSWDPLPPALQSSIVRFDILIDGNLTASVPPEGLSFEEEPLFGEHSYTVVAVTAAVGPVEPLPGSNIIVGDCAVNYQPPRIGGFVRGDANADQSEDLSDAVFILLYLFQGAPSPSCLKSADTNDDGAVDLSDPVHLLNFLFLGQSPPPMPHPDCDQDPTEDKLSCDAFGPCFNPPPP